MEIAGLGFLPALSGLRRGEVAAEERPRCTAGERLKAAAVDVINKKVA